jgi:MoaA/NifB/PqqE/SkfB family radical SAM enzyme
MGFLLHQSIVSKMFIVITLLNTEHLLELYILIYILNILETIMFFSFMK